MKSKKIILSGNMGEKEKKRIESMHTLSTKMIELIHEIEEISDRIELTILQNSDISTDKLQAMDFILIDLNNMIYTLRLQYAFITQSVLSEFLINRLSEYEDIENSDLEAIKLTSTVYDNTVKLIFSKDIDNKLIEIENILKNDIISKEEFLKFKNKYENKNTTNKKEPEEVVKDFMIKKSTNSDIKN